MRYSGEELEKLWNEFDDVPFDEDKDGDLVLAVKKTELHEIGNKLGLAETLAQLAEEGAELSKAALKLRRVLDGKNPTPVAREEAENNLQEEFADVLMCMTIIGIDKEKTTQTINRKTDRWIKRLEEGRG